MVFSDFVESVVETPICCELKQHLDKLYDIYSKDPEKCVLSLKPQQRGSTKSHLLMILLPLLLKLYEEGEDKG